MVAVLALPGGMLRADPPAKPERNRSSSSAKQTTDRGPTLAQLLESANGWRYVNGEWIHPNGYKFVNNRVLRTTARTGRPLPKPPGKLALENPMRLTAPPKSMTVPSQKDDAKTAAEKAAEQRQKNLTPTAAPQTGTHL